MSTVKTKNKIDLRQNEKVQQAKKQFEHLQNDINHPCSILCGEVLVHMKFSDTEKGLDSLLINYFKGLKKG